MPHARTVNSIRLSLCTACQTHYAPDETKDGMDIDPEGQLSQGEHVSAVAPGSAPVTAPTMLSPHKARMGRLSIPFAVRDDTTPSEALASALTNSLRFKSSATTTSIAIDESGAKATVASEGVTDFDTGASTQVLRIVSGGERIGEVVVSDGSKIYVHLDGGIIAKVVAGKSWVSLPTGQSVATSVTGGGGASNDAAIVRVLSAPGNDVSDLGPSRVNGRDVRLYSVHLTRSQINRDIAQEHLPQFEREAIALVHIPAITYTLAINGVNQLIQMKATLHLHADGQQVTEDLTEGYSRYGTRVTVTTPPPREVIPFQTYLQIAEEKGMRVTI